MDGGCLGRIKKMLRGGEERGNYRLVNRTGVAGVAEDG
jgi:hypothetical protein